MRKKAIKALAVVLMLAVTVSVLSACGRGVPNGRYEPVQPEMEMIMQAIVINGSRFTQVMPFTGIEVTTRYTYDRNTGAISISEGGVKGTG